MKRFSEYIADTMKLPKEVAMDLPKLSVAGNKEIFIENHKGLVEYKDDFISVKMKDGLIKVFGRDLRIIIMREDRIVINGTFERVEYEI